MATLRLSDSDKQQLCNQFFAELSRCRHNRKFPLKKKQIYKLGLTILPKDVRKAFRLLSEKAGYLVAEECRRATIQISDTNNEYRAIVSYIRWPSREDGIVPPDHEHYPVLLEWCQNFHEIHAKVELAGDYVRSIVCACTSAGQIKRILPDEVLRLLPAHITRSFGDAERQSRIPASFRPDPIAEENLVSMLALAAISPEKRKGIAVYLHRITIEVEL